MNEWIRTKNLVPDHIREVEVIFLIDDFDPANLMTKLQRRLIGIGKFDHSYGWFVNNGYIKSVHLHVVNDPYMRWDYVTHWRELDEQTSEILAKRGWDKEDFK